MAHAVRRTLRRARIDAGPPCITAKEAQPAVLELFTAEAFSALVKVILIDLVLAGDNAIVIGLAAAGLPEHQRAKAILIGIGAATAMRIGFAAVTTQLLADRRPAARRRAAAAVGVLEDVARAALHARGRSRRKRRHHQFRRQCRRHHCRVRAPRKTLSQAAWQIIIADVSMSLDNVLAVAGAARDHPHVLVFGLLLSIALMGVAASFIARLLQKHRWIAYVGLAVILYVAVEMIYRGGVEVKPVVVSMLAMLGDGS